MIRIGILGAGYIAHTHAKAWLDNGEVELSGASWAGEASLNKLLNKFGVPAVNDVDELLAQSDAVDVCLPTGLHEEAVLRAAAAPRHVLCEKPMAATLEAADRMAAACRDAGVIFMAAHCLRFWPEYMYLKRAIERGQHGRLLWLDLERFSSFPDWSSRGWLTDTAQSGGPALDLHIHDADMISYLLGAPRAVSAHEISTPSCMGIAVDYDYGGAPVAHARGGWIAQRNYPFHMAYRAVFESAVVEFDSRNTPAVRFTWPRGKPPAPFIQKTNGYRLQAKHFAECVANKKQPETATAQDARDSLALALAARESARTGRPVEFGA